MPSLRPLWANGSAARNENWTAALISSAFREVARRARWLVSGGNGDSRVGGSPELPATIVTDFFLRLLGAPGEEVLRIADASLAWRGAHAGWIIFAILVTAAAVFWIYRVAAGTLSVPRRILLTALRICFLALILLLFLRPVLSLTVEGSVRRLLVLLVDGSASMRIQDPRLDVIDQKRAAIAKGILQANRGLNQELSANQKRLVEQVPRIDLVKAVFKNEALALLPKLDQEFDLAAFTFGESLVELASQKSGSAGTNGSPSDQKARIDQFSWIDRLSANSSVTALGDAIREVLNRKRGQPIAGILVISDGANNSGSQPRETGQYSGQERVPIYTYGVGITSPRDIIVANLFAPEVSFVRDEVTVTARVRSQGLRGESGELTLKLGDAIVARKTVTFLAEEQVVSLRFTPQAQGEFELTAAVAPRADEAVQDNNSRSQQLRIIDTKIKVLMVEQAPRWEFRYLQALLLRDRRVELKCYLVEGDPG
ncbi:MAG TPA: hypothetical protein VK633_05285, partial [Verrucomicrobiae bacterium]|nr:hypothetical protein [Verrucomicrobiae bacterium]